MHSTTLRHPLLITLAAEIGSDRPQPLTPYAPTAELWQTAGIFVTDDAFALSDSEAARQGDLGVLTRHARPLSWLFFELRNDSRLTGGPWAERAFFGRLADAANAFLAAHQPEEDDCRALLQSVLREAGEVLRERYAHLDSERRRAAVRTRSRRTARRFPAATLALIAA